VTLLLIIIIIVDRSDEMRTWLWMVCCKICITITWTQWGTPKENYVMMFG